MSGVSSRLHHDDGHPGVLEPIDCVADQASRNAATLKIGIHRNHVDLAHLILGVEFQRDESGNSRLLRCDPYVYVRGRADRCDCAPLSRAPIIAIERTINGGKHCLLERFEHGLPGPKRQADDRIELRVLEALDRQLESSTLLRCH